MLRRPSFARIAFLLGATIGLFGCEGEPPRTALNYTESAKKAYDNALAEFNAHSWIQAQLMMREVKRKYSYSRYARLAELRIADADMVQEKYTDAIHEYKDFIHAHRAEEEDVAYARSRIAEATYDEIPEAFFIAASEERDQAGVVDAYKEFKAYLSDYPSSKESAHMRDLLAQVVGRLIKHEIYVARFYLARENYDATIARIQYALKNYASATGASDHAVDGASALEAEALVLLGETYLRMHSWQLAREAFVRAVSVDELGAAAEHARNYLDSLGRKGV